MKFNNVVNAAGRILSAALILIFFVSSASAQTSRSYELYMRLGRKAYDARDYQKALSFFKQARLANPSSFESVQYIDQIKQYIHDEEEKTKMPSGSVSKISSAGSIKNTPVEDESAESDVLELSGPAFPSANENFEQTAKEYQTAKKISFVEKPEKKTESFEQILPLDHELWQEQPNTQLSIELDKTIILEGRNIEKFLVITEGFISAERMDRDHVRIKAEKRGETFFHIWDEHGRWTFNIEVIFPEALTKGVKESLQDMSEDSVKPFRFFYSNHWSTLYGGEDLSKLTKRSREFRQWMSLNGETPYGDMTNNVTFTTFGDETVATSYTTGLSKGHIGQFKDFSVRAFDTDKRFSDLSLPGRNFRGILFDSYAFSRNIKYTILEGRDQSSFANLTPGLTKKQKHFLEGAQLVLFPDSKNNYTINYARGTGANRPVDLKDKVFSFETHNLVGKTKWDSEIAHDDDQWAGRLRANKETKESSLNWSFRDIEKGFATITGRPSGRGEIGSNINYQWRNDKKNFGVYLDLFNDREQDNPDSSAPLNVDFSTNFGYRLNPKLRYASTFYYLTSPQIISERTDMRFNHSLTRTFAFFNKENISFTLGNAFQASRYKLTPSSEFDRYEVSAGLQIPLIKYFYWFLNYEYSWVDEIDTGSWTHPSVATGGVTYSQALTDKLSGNANVTYRNEEDTEGQVSFLSGEDSLTTNVGLDYRIAPETTIFVDGRLRNVWAENKDRLGYNEAELRLGVNAGFDTPFYWNPIGLVKGYVYFDVNRNGIKDRQEKGVADVTIKIGRKTVKTNSQGKYVMRVNAKKVKMAVDTRTLPAGAFFSTDAEYEADIIKNRIHTVDFGISTQTGIYGVVYFDQNGNKQLDSGDIYIGNVAIKLDDQEKVVSDTQGGYNFYNVKPGKHTITFDVNSLPLEYIPLIKVTNKVHVKEGITAIFNIPLKKK